MLDPMVAARDPLLTPQSLRLDSFATRAGISNLLGFGVLVGSLADVRNGIECEGWFGAYKTQHDFEYAYGDSRFSEAMTYAWSDRFLQWMAQQGPNGSGYTFTQSPVPIVARFPEHDNAFYSFNPRTGGEFVAIGISGKTPGASFSDDAHVFVHELQHGFTTHAYSSSEGLGSFAYDEAGALNEAISDFVALLFSESSLPGGWDPRWFSRWALGQFWIPYDRKDHSRGAYRCPAWDARFPACSGGPDFSADQNHISYVYPDGLGWSFGANYEGPGYVQSAFMRPDTSDHEIHNNSVLMTGALWDAYQALLARHSSDRDLVKRWMVGLVQEATALLPIPMTGATIHLAPATFRAYASALVAAAQTSLQLPADDRAALSSALQARGLYSGETVTDTAWLGVGPGARDAAGVIQTPGFLIEDNPDVLRIWAPIQPAQRLGNGTLNAGESAALWPDLLNRGAISVGGLLVDVTIEGSGVSFIEGLNPGRISATRAQRFLPKLYGSRAITALSSARANYHVPVGTSFLSMRSAEDPQRIGRVPDLAFWVKANSNVAPGTVVQFRITVTPSNGVASTASFPLTVR